MTSEEVTAILGKLQFHFRNTYSEDELVHWAELLSEQPFAVSNKVVQHYLNNSATGWMVSPAEFVVRIKEEQTKISRAEARNINSASCSECSGLTWVTDDPSGVIPCPQCRVSSNARWRESSYVIGVPSNQDELDGPKQPYQVAAEPKHFSRGKPVELARAAQWAAHIKNPNAETVYPEGDFEVAVEEDTKPKEKEEFIEF